MPTYLPILTVASQFSASISLLSFGKLCVLYEREPHIPPLEVDQRRSVLHASKSEMDVFRDAQENITYERLSSYLAEMCYNEVE
jgi:hypothetical protein